MIVESKISHFDDYCYIDFYREGKQVFDGMEAFLTFFRERFPRIGVMILFGKTYMLKKDTKDDLHSRVGYFHLDLTYEVKEKILERNKLVEKTIIIKPPDISALCSGYIPTYAKETFKPLGYNLQKDEYNAWVGFKAETDPDDPNTMADMKIVQPILDFIREVISNGEEENFKYIISWLSHIICKPWRKTEVALFLHSNEKGTGKGTLGYWLKNYLFGSHIANVISGLSKLTQKHNTSIQKKIFTLVEELPSLQGDFHAQFDAMKHVITDPQITIEPKGVDAFEIPNFANFMLLSNNLMSIKLERGDRRYACFEVSSHKKGDEDYWDHIHETVLTEETAKEFYKYLKHLPDAYRVSLRKIPKTKIRETLIDNSTPVHEQFFEDIQKDDGSYSFAPGAFIPAFVYKDKEITSAIRSDTLYRCYEHYCNTRKEKVLRQRLFFNSIGKFVNKGMTKIEGKTTRFYTIKP